MSYLLNSYCISRGTASPATRPWQHAMALSWSDRLLVWAALWPIHSQARWPRRLTREPVCWVLSWGLPTHMSQNFFYFSAGPDLSLNKRWCKFSSSCAADSKLCSRVSPSICSSVLLPCISRAACEEPWNTQSDSCFPFLCASRLSSHSSQLVTALFPWISLSTVPTSQILVISKRCLFPQKTSNEVTVCSLHSQPDWEKSKYPIISWNSYCMKIKQPKIVSMSWMVL